MLAPHQCDEILNTPLQIFSNLFKFHNTFSKRSLPQIMSTMRHIAVTTVLRQSLVHLFCHFFSKRRTAGILLFPAWSGNLWDNCSHYEQILMSLKEAQQGYLWTECVVHSQGWATLKIELCVYKDLWWKLIVKDWGDFLWRKYCDSMNTRAWQCAHTHTVPQWCFKRHSVILCSSSLPAVVACLQSLAESKRTKTQRGKRNGRKDREK